PQPQSQPQRGRLCAGAQHSDIYYRGCGARCAYRALLHPHVPGSFQNH
nr:hypothetical protein [Tanacetum cinerariifolium]